VLISVKTGLRGCLDTGIPARAEMTYPGDLEEREKQDLNRALAK
jgi:hypothetical protein